MFAHLASGLWSTHVVANTGIQSLAIAQYGIGFLVAILFSAFCIEALSIPSIAHLDIPRIYDFSFGIRFVEHTCCCKYGDSISGVAQFGIGFLVGILFSDFLH